VAADDFNIVQWIGPLLTRENRRRLNRSFPFPAGRGKTKKFGLSTAFDPRFEQVVPSQNVSPDAIHKALARLGAPGTCRVISPSYKYGETVPLHQALESALNEEWDQDVVVLCLPGRLLFWHDQYLQHVIVHRRADA
jgi:hypothetical protein